MGQAKQGGSQDGRAKQASEKIERFKPLMILCNSCKNEITDVQEGILGSQAYQTVKSDK